MGEQLASERAARMRAGKVIGPEAAGIEQGNGQRIAQRQRCRRAGGGRQIERAGFLVDPGIQMRVRLPG